jgi:hypothetical protein
MHSRIKFVTDNIAILQNYSTSALRFRHFCFTSTDYYPTVLLWGASFLTKIPHPLKGDQGKSQKYSLQLL